MIPKEAAVAAGTNNSGTKNIPKPTATAPVTAPAPMARFLTKCDGSACCGC